VQLGMLRKLTLLGVLVIVPQLSAAERLILGWVERVVIETADFEMRAKLDSGALTSSIHATDIERFEKDGQEYVRFTLHAEQGDEGQVIEKPLSRNVRIKRHGVESQRRPVVKLAFCIGGESRKAEFSLVDREHFIYPVLLGRRVLSEVALVDSAETYLSGHACRSQAE
jgi:hypothetical protein